MPSSSPHDAAAATARRLAAAGPLPAGPYELLLADPPYDYGPGRQHAGAGSLDTGGAASHYPTLRLADLTRLDIAGIAADDALLFLWSTSPHFDQALTLARAWGFTPRTIAHVWQKPRANPSYYTLSSIEVMIGATRGEPDLAVGIPPNQLVRAPRGPHSAKPPELRAVIAARFPHLRKIELFARDAAPGWDTWGLDSPSRPSR